MFTGFLTADLGLFPMENLDEHRYYHTYCMLYYVYSHEEQYHVKYQTNCPMFFVPMHKAKRHLVCLNLDLFPLSEVYANGNTYATVTNSCNCAH